MANDVKRLMEWDPGNGTKHKHPSKGPKNWGCLHPEASPDTICPNCTRDCSGNYPTGGDTFFGMYGETSCCDWMLSDPYEMPLAPDKGNKLKKMGEECGVKKNTVRRQDVDRARRRPYSSRARDMRGSRNTMKR